jgi:UDP-N-acetylglucosamine:LPS N-acetylglucosamine transferase
LASADVLVTKPGYSTAVEAVALAKPVVYVRRHNFADEASLVEYLHRFGRAVELSAEEFSRGSWQAAFDRLETLPQPPPAPPATGAVEAATILARYVKREA